MGRAVRNAVVFLAVAVLSLTLVESVRAQRHRPPPREIRCDSDAHKHTYCPTSTRGQVRLQRRISNAPCREYYTWGADRDGGGLWVRDGCRAVFVVLPWGPGPGPGQGPRPPTKIVCKSEGFKPNYCPVPRVRDVQLDKRLSDARCRQYDTWGWNGGGIWVDKGCAARFLVR